MAAEAAAGPPQDLREVIEDSVADHLVADVPVSTFLSGGLDSSIVTVLAKRSNPELDAYTITFRPEDHRLEAMPDDAVYARKVARQFGIKLHEIEVAPDIVDLLPRIVDVLDEPVGDPAAINTLLMCEAARDAGVKVVLSGMGADELFGGYRKHLACLLAATVPPGARPRPPGRPGRGRPRSRSSSPAAGCATSAGPSASSTSPSSPRPRGSGAATRSTTRRTLADLLSPDLAPARRRRSSPSTTPSTPTRSLDDPINRMCLADTRLFLPGLNLAYTDRASMAASVEVRVPFVDPTVVAAAFSIPGKRQDPRPDLQGGAEGRRARPGCPPRSSTGRRRRSAPRCGPGSPATCGPWSTRSCWRRSRRRAASSSASRSSSWSPTSGAAGQDNSKQIWQLLSLELWCRQARSAGVAV